MKIFVTVASPVRWVSIKRKCGDDSRLFLRRLWNDLCKNKRYNAPHLYSVRSDTERANAPIHIQEMSAVRCPLALKTSTFS